MNTEYKMNLPALLDYVDPASLDYTEWLSVGMALKHEGYTVADWEAWSRRDPARYHPGECDRKWGGFGGAATPVTGATITQMAKDRGWRSETLGGGYALDWNSEISGKDSVVVDEHYIEEQEITEPIDWHPGEQITKYLSTLFEASDFVGYVCETYEKDGRYLPSRGSYTRTAGELLEKLQKYGDDIGAVFGDYNVEAGAWIRFNPLDGNDVKNDNVTNFRYALVESDNMPIAKQNAIIRELELPVACLVFSGGKSLHAIVRVDAPDFETYRKRVAYLYDVCKKNGFNIDSQNRNPSRLSRLPGATRNGHKQFIVATQIGKGSWDEWYEWVEGVNDDLPDPESLAGVWGNLPNLSPPLIENILRRGHKMLLAGPSKAGKSYALIQLCCAIAEGRRWFDWECARGRVLYVNLELDRASCLHRFKDVYEALGWDPQHLDNIDIWNLRGKAVPMDKLAPKLIRRAQKKNYIAIVIDPIYKVITGDENSADQMARFCNQFDRVCHELGAAVIYCHHHSKGSQGQKRSMDRASGSGVFARDPDVLLDLIELETTEALAAQEENRVVCQVCVDWLDDAYGREGWEGNVSQDDMLSSKNALEACDRFLEEDIKPAFYEAVDAARRAASYYTAWRIEGTLREFPRFDPINLWFTYPIHRPDDTGALGDIKPESEMAPYEKGLKRSQDTAGKRKQDRRKRFDEALQFSDFGAPTVKSVAEFLGLGESAVRKQVSEYGHYIDKNDGTIKPKDLNTERDTP